MSEGTVNLEELAKSITTSVREGAKAALEDLGSGSVDRSRVAITLPALSTSTDTPKPAYGTAARVHAPWNSRYRHLPEWEREIRNEDVDHWIQEWSLGMMKGDHGRMERAHEAISKMPQWEREQRDLNTTSDSALIPSPMAALIVENRRKLQVIGPRAQHFQSSSTTLKVPTQLQYATVQRPGEAGTITPDDPTHSSVTFTKRKSLVSTRSSYEFINDNAFNAVGFLAAGAARTLALDNDTQDMTAGTGVGENQTDAIEANSSIAIVNATVGVLAYNDVVDMFYALLSQYRGNAVWMGSNTALKELAQIVDSNGRPIFAAGDAPADVISGGQGSPGVGTIFSRPVIETPASSGTLVFGDLQFYGVLEESGIRADVSTDEAFLTDEITWKWVQRRDGAVLNAAGFVKSTGITIA